MRDDKAAYRKAVDEASAGLEAQHKAVQLRRDERLASAARRYEEACRAPLAELDRSMEAATARYEARSAQVRDQIAYEHEQFDEAEAEALDAAEDPDQEDQIRDEMRKRLARMQERHRHLLIDAGGRELEQEEAALQQVVEAQLAPLTREFREEREAAELEYLAACEAARAHFGLVTDQAQRRFCPTAWAEEQAAAERRRRPPD